MNREAGWVAVAMQRIGAPAWHDASLTGIFDEVSSKQESESYYLTDPKLK